MRFELEEILQIIEKVKQSELELFEYRDVDVKLKIKGKQPIWATSPQNVSMAEVVPGAQNGNRDVNVSMVEAVPGTQNGRWDVNVSMAEVVPGIQNGRGDVNVSMAEVVPGVQNGNREVNMSLETPAGKAIESPMVGTFYAAPSQDAEPFVKVGDHVKKGQTVGIVEAMKLMNEIEAEADGIVTEILVKNEQMVEYGQPLMYIR